MAEDFGPFNPLFQTALGDDVPGYLQLLNLRNAHSAVRSLRDACTAEPQVVSSHTRAMLRYLSWRVQLVAASAMVIGDLTDCLDDLWAALDRPCWTSPQLAATAALIDADFLDKARIRLNGRCYVTSDHAAALSAIERHVAMGPASGAGHSAKMFSALFALCGELKAPWLADFEAEDDVAALLATDPDNGGAIALRWKKEITALKGQTSSGKA